MRARTKVFSVVAVIAALALAAPMFSFAGGRGGSAARGGNPSDSQGQGQMGSGVPVSPAEAYAAMTVPGAVTIKPGAVASGPSGTTYVETAPGLTLRQAVGLDPIPAATLAALKAKTTSNVDTASAAGASPSASVTPNVSPCCGSGGGWTGCEHYNYKYTWSPSDVSINDETTYCGSSGILTSRATDPVLGGSLGCTTGSTSQYVDNGGIGQTWEDWTDVGYFTCYPSSGVTHTLEMHVGGPLTSTSYSYVGNS